MHEREKRKGTGRERRVRERRVERRDGGTLEARGVQALAVRGACGARERCGRVERAALCVADRRRAVHKAEHVRRRGSHRCSETLQRTTNTRIYYFLAGKVNLQCNFPCPWGGGNRGLFPSPTGVTALLTITVTGDYNNIN